MSGQIRTRRLERAAVVLFAFALRSIPASARTRWAPEMTDTFRRRLRESADRHGPFAALTTTLSEVAALLPVALQERFGSPPETRGVSRKRLPRRPRPPRFDPGSELRAAARSLRRRPGYGALVVLTLGLGIGSASSLFTVVDHVLLRPMAFDPDGTLLDLMHHDPDSGVSFFGQTLEEVERWRAQSHVFAGVEMADGTSFVLREGQEPERITGARVSTGLLPFLGARPLLGRLFDRDDRVEASTTPLVVSRGFWQSRLGGDPSAIGSTLRLDEREHVVVGVVADDFTFPYPTTQVWVPAIEVPRARSADIRFEAVARLRDGIDLEQAEREIARISERFAAEGVGADGFTLALSPRSKRRAGGWDRSALLLLASATGLLLLIACANAANLGLAAATSRRSEIAIRSALGASRARLGRSLLTESLGLSLLGGALGLLLARTALPAVMSLVPEELTFHTGRSFAIDWRVVLFCFAASVLTGFLTGIVPALRGSRPRALETLRGAARDGGEQGTRHRIGGGLVVVQVALALVLLIGAGLLIRSFVAVQSVDLGFEPEGLLALRVSLDESSVALADAHSPGGAEGGDAVMSREEELKRAGAFYERLVESVAALPGVVSVATGSGVPPRAGGISFGVSPQAEGREPIETGPDFVLPFSVVDHRYFSTLGFHLEEGRGFEPEDEGTPVVVLGSTMARAVFGEESAVGQRFRLDDDNEWRTVVGVAADVRTMGPIDSFGDMEIYYPFGAKAPGRATARMLIVRVAEGIRVADLVAPVKSAVWELDPGIPLAEASGLDQLLAESMARPRFLFLLMSAFAALALVLAAVGLFAVVTYSVRRRTGEIGIRMALGALRSDVVGMVLRQSFAYGAVGALLGLAGALASVRWIESLLFDIQSTDPATWLTVCLLLLSVVLLASLLPAWRATRVEPVRALRAD